MSPAFDRRFTPARADLAAESLRGLVSAPRYAAPRPMRVVEELLPLSRERRRDAPIDTQALFGEMVDVYEIDEEGWAWGQLTRDGYVGHMPAEGLRDAGAPPTRRVSAVRAHVYPAPDMKLPPVMALPLGAEFAAGDERGDFVAVAGAGFVWRAHTSARSEREADHVAVAERFEHVPYLWGGKTSLGIDCSGLAQVSLGAAGIAAPRDTDVMEAAAGEPLAFDAGLSGLARGDLVFWKGHVGIMRDAATLLHANGHRMRVSSEPLRAARDRILAAAGGDITSIRRPRPPRAC